MSLSLLTSGSGHRPGQAGTTGQLFFTKCGDPPEGCDCKYEEPKGKTIINFPRVESLIYMRHNLTIFLTI